jgi:hypothetical protein
MLQASCLIAEKRDPTPSLAIEIAPLYQLKPSKRDAVAARPSFFDLMGSVSKDFHSIFIASQSGCFAQMTGFAFVFQIVKERISSKDFLPSE